MILHEIHNSYILARKYIERCCITVSQDGKTIHAFTECEGKNRVTDWGGTSSALYLLAQTGTNGNTKFENEIQNAENWLLSDQAKDGSWEAAEMQCCEATSAVVFDLKSIDRINKKQLNKAIEYVQRCYHERGANGYFLSKPQISQTPHIYTTYLSVKALYTVGRCMTPRQKKYIKNWINSSQSSDGKWGQTPNCATGDVAHTVFALSILYYCDMPIKEIKRRFSRTIKWLYKQIKFCSTLNGAFSYEATEVYLRDKGDMYGEGAYILKSYHFNLALICDFFLKIKRYDISQRIIKKLIKLRNEQEGWGLNAENKIFVWATQQAIDCMYQFESSIFKNKNFFISRLRSLIYCVPYFPIKFIAFILIIPIILWILKYENMLPSLILSLIMLVLPWIIKFED